MRRRLRRIARWDVFDWMLAMLVLTDALGWILLGVCVGR